LFKVCVDGLAKEIATKSKGAKITPINRWSLCVLAPLWQNKTLFRNVRRRRFQLRRRCCGIDRDNWKQKPSV